MYIKIDFERETELEDSKFYGEIALPEKWLEQNVFGAEEMFVCQIRADMLNRVQRGALPFENGTLFFFIDLKKAPYKAIVRYFDGDMEAYCCFNEEMESEVDVLTPLAIDFTDSPDGASGRMLFTDSNTDGLLCLLKIDYDEDDPVLPFNGDVYFLISPEDFEKGNFHNVKFKTAIKNEY